MATSAQGHAEFAARLNRIETRGAGVSEVFNGGRTKLIGGAAKPAVSKWKNRSANLFKQPLALVVGALSFIGAKFATFMIGELPEEFSNPDYVLGGEVMIALALIFTCRLFFSLSHKTHLVLSLAGLVAMLGLMHNLVHMEPELWAMAFSYDWVAEILSSTRVNTAQFRDVVITLG